MGLSKPIPGHNRHQTVAYAFHYVGDERNNLMLYYKLTRKQEVAMRPFAILCIFRLLHLVYSRTVIGSLVLVVRRVAGELLQTREHLALEVLKHWEDVPGGSYLMPEYFETRSLFCPERPGDQVRELPERCPRSKIEVRPTALPRPHALDSAAAAGLSRVARLAALARR